MEILQELLQEIVQENANRAHEQTIEKGQWQWKSNADPWSKSEEPQWKSYSLEQNYLLEKAYYSQQKEVDLGDYIISIEHRIQRKEGSLIAQRPIRRIGQMEDEEKKIRCERYFETELPKTINKVFGNLDDFVSFFSKRSSEIFNFAEQFTKFEESNNIDGFNEFIIPEVLASLQREWKKSHSKDPDEQSLSPFQKKLKMKTKRLEEQLMSFFEKKFPSFQEFYEHVLRVYTMDTFLFKNLNKYLRNESWEEISDLLPYALCLCKAFFNSKKGSNRKASKSCTSLFLYRGTAFDELALSYYDLKQTQVFGWNSITSTTRELTVAKNFMLTSADIKNKRFPVLFIIEVPRGENEPDETRLVDMQNYSAFPEEGEVILAPGSVFELQEMSKDENEITTIKIKLKRDPETLAYRGLIMPGTLQKEMMSQREVKLMCLEREELEENLKHISGNKLVQEIEFCLCKFDNKRFKAMLRTLPTLEHVKDLKFISCSLNDDDNKRLKEILKNQKSIEVRRLEVADAGSFCEILWRQIEECEFWRGLDVLEINFLESQNITDKQLSDLCSQVLRRLEKLKSLSLHLKGCIGITEKGINDLSCRGLKYLSKLTSLNLNLQQCKVTDKGVFDLSSLGLKSLTQLASLTMNFQSNFGITDEAINYLSCHGLQNLKKLTNLELSFERCPQIREEGFSYLSSQGLKYLNQLTSFSLNFSKEGISSPYWSHFRSQGLRNLTQLRSLDLHFLHCSSMYDEGVENLCCQGLQYLISLRSLSLDFGDCSITNKSIEALCIYRLKYPNQLSALSLNFSHNSKITDEGIYHLWSHGLAHLDELKSLELIFRSCRITQKGINYLQTQVQKLSSKLSDLNLNFDKCFESFSSIQPPCKYLRKPTGVEEFSKLTCTRKFQESRAQKNIPTSFNVVPLNLAFPNSENLTKRDIEDICILKINKFTQLQSLTLSFWDSPPFDDEALNVLCSQGLSQLVQLISLNLNLGWCTSITDEGISYLCSKGLQNLLKLRTLNLSLNSLFRITDKGIEILSTQGLKYLNQLESLTLDLCAFGIANETINVLCYQGLKHLPQLTCLDLCLQECRNITDEGINNFCFNGIKQLPQLVLLKLNFDGCPGVSEFTTLNIQKILRYFGFIPEHS